MRVPTRSAGTRSGVNWMRLKSPPKASGRARGRAPHRLAEAGGAPAGDVAPREERDDQPFEQVILTDDDLLDLVQEPLHRGGSVLAWWVVHAACPLLAAWAGP